MRFTAIAEPGLLVVTDIDQARLDRAASIYTVEDAAKHGVKLVYANTRENAVEMLMGLTDGKGYDDVLVFAPVPAVIEQADAVLAFDGCLNFFAGPTNPALSANFNFYNVHYAAHHLVGTSGGNTDDMREALHMIAEGKLNPAGMITHVGGLNAVVETTLNLPEDSRRQEADLHQHQYGTDRDRRFREEGRNRSRCSRSSPKFAAKNNNLWCGEAEAYLLEHAPKI